ncbi:MAG: hypothetical protein AUJ98_03715 [Bacteroidetes bacterium CG2_30_33_31]|nr:MAG: hypothetical protein AUJ98_03715 [Bacteroidetes bacterium CG2_30_33_31]
MKIKSIIYSILVLVFAGFINQGICQSDSINNKYSLSLDGGGYFSVNKKIFGAVAGLNLQSKNSKFGLNARLKYQNFYLTTPVNLFANHWFIGFAEVNYKIEKIKNFPFKISLGLGPVSEDIDLFYTVNPYWDLGYIVTASIQKQVKNFEFEFRIDDHTINFFHLNFPYLINGNSGNTIGWRYNFTFGVIYRLKLFEF